MKKAILAICVIALFVAMGVSSAAPATNPTTGDPYGMSAQIRCNVVRNRLQFFNFLDQRVIAKMVTVTPPAGLDATYDVRTGYGTVVIDIVSYDSAVKTLFGLWTVSITSPEGKVITKHIRPGIIWDFIPTTFEFPKV